MFRGFSFFVITECEKSSSVQQLILYHASGHCCHFVIVIGVFCVWRVGLILVLVPTGQSREEKSSSSQQHEAPAEVKRQVVRVHPVVNPAWSEKPNKWQSYILYLTPLLSLLTLYSRHIYLTL